MEKKQIPPCLFNLFARCIVVENSPKLISSYGSEYWVKNICPLCLKSYRLRYGLSYYHENKGLRTGVTL